MQVMTSAPQRRWSAFSLRTLFVLVTVLCVLLGWRIHYVRQAHNAVDAILSLGGGVGWVRIDNLPPDSRTNGSLDWIAEIFGLRYPVWAGFPGAGKYVTDDDLDRLLLPLTSLKDISIIDAFVTDSGLLRLRALTSLTRIQCIRDPRNHKAVDELSQFTSIETTNVPLEDLTAYLVDLHGIPFEIDKQTLMAAGIPANVLITCKVAKNTLSLEEALDTTLKPYKLGWVLNEGRIIVTSADNARRDRRRVLMHRLRAALPNLKELKVD